MVTDQLNLEVTQHKCNIVQQGKKNNTNNTFCMYETMNFD